jgi:hypothetical protein
MADACKCLRGPLKDQSSSALQHMAKADAQCECAGDCDLFSDTTKL